MTESIGINPLIVTSRDQDKRQGLSLEEHQILATECLKMHYGLSRLEDITDGKLADRSRCAEVIRRLRQNLSQARCLLDNVMNDEHYGVRSPYFRSVEAGNESR